VSGSLALLADAAHMFTDVAALILAYAAMSLADRAPTRKHSFGLYRAEILAAFVNAQILLVVSGYILWEAYKRFQAPEPIETGLMLGVAIAGLAANLVSMKLLHGGRERSLNVKAAYLEVVTDVMGSLGVIAAALLMRPTGWYWLDPIISAAIGLFIVPRTISLLRQSGHILLEGSPREVDLNALREKLLSLPGVEAVHDMHLWTLTSGVNSASAHIRTATDRPREEIRSAVREVFEDHAGVDHATIQIETSFEPECRDAEKHP
jgi:cobalt-zinc-cadmium efflux system protein